MTMMQNSKKGAFAIIADILSAVFFNGTEFLRESTIRLLQELLQTGCLRQA